MDRDAEADLPVDEEVLTAIRDRLSRHPVSVAMLFGSVVRDEATDHSDIDLAIAFESLSPGDEDYNDVYFRLRSDLADVSEDVDVVDVRSMSPSFARVVFDDGIVLLGSEDERAELESDIAGDRPTVAAARKRVATVAERLREGERSH